jgi:DUF1680 family protein
MRFLLAIILCVAASGADLHPVPNRAPLQRGSYTLLPLASVKPKGWLKKQLEIQANGLSGHLDEFWPDVGPNSAWLGGTGEGWERGPYFMDGVVPLAYLLEDPKLIGKVVKWMDWTLSHQRNDGAIGPEKNTDWWPNMVMLKALTQYQEATGDARVIPVLEKYFAYQLSKMSSVPLKEWAIYRWPDEVVSVLWLYNRTGNPKLLELAKALKNQGYDWKSQFADFPYREKVQKGQTNLKTHVVNNAMALKTSGVWWLVSGDPEDRQAVTQQLRIMDRYHLLPNGIHSGDEHYAGLDPSQGSELCSVVEAMYSLEHLIAITGDAALGDRHEKIAYNALPGTFTDDMWAHQYDQQPNQIQCSIHPRNWTSNGPDSNLFGLEPNFGCCTANMHQGWPKFAANLWMATRDGGVAAVAYAPNEVQTVVAGDVPVTISEQTDYPYSDSIRITVNPKRSATFPIELRIPAWADEAEIRVAGRSHSGMDPGKFFRIARRWRAGDVIDIRFPMKVRKTRWFHGSMALERGPIVYSLKIGSSWHKLAEHGPAADWEVNPTTPWNYALLESGKIDIVQTPQGPELQVQGRRLPQWTIENGSAGTLPQSPVASSEPLETLTLIPYGRAKLRITAFPVLDR